MPASPPSLTCSPAARPLPADWRVRVLLWPDSSKCEPLCMKLRGYEGDVGAYGRTASC